MNNTTNITILATSARGAKLVTNGTKAAWVMGRQVREDGTLTAGAREALEISNMDHAAGVQLAAAIQGNREAQEELAVKRAAERQAKANALVTVNILPANWCGEHGNAWQVRTNNTFRNRFGRVCTACCFLPKSKVTVVRQADGTVNVTMPAWVLWNNGAMVHTVVSE